MLLTEISDIFDTKLQTFYKGCYKDEYEKSLYLTKAQDIYYDSIIKIFEDTNIISEKIDRLLNTETITSFSAGTFGGNVATFSSYVRKVLRERVTYSTSLTIPSIYRGKEVQVKEERLSEIEDSLKNPFRVAGEYSVLRTVVESQGFNKVELYIPNTTSIAKYTVTLAIEPNPIILEDLPSELSIRNISTATAALSFKDKDILNIVEIAVSLALQDVKTFTTEENKNEKE